MIQSPNTHHLAYMQLPNNNKNIHILLKHYYTYFYIQYQFLIIVT